jgi:hypothetical protein
VTVYFAGSSTIAPVYSDNLGSSTTNPFNSDHTGYWFFYANPGRYDVRFSGTLISSPFALGDFQSLDPGYDVTINPLALLSVAISAGKTQCTAGTVSYAGGTMSSLAANTTNYIYLDGTSSCAPAKNTSGFATTAIPLAEVTTGSSAITSIIDRRNMLSVGSVGGIIGSSITINSQTCTLSSSCTIPFQVNSASNTSQAGINLITSSTNSIGLTATPSNPTTNQVKFEITGAYTGNSATATALASTPSGCATNSFADAIAANGNLTCAAAVTANTGAAHNWLSSLTAAGVFSYSQPASSDLSDYGSIPNAALANPSMTVNSQTCTLGSTCTIPFQTNTVGNTSQAGINLLASSVNAVGLTVTPTNSATNQEKFEVTGAAYTGNSATATALAALPAQCTGIQFATGINANGDPNCATPSGGSGAAPTIDTNTVGNTSQILLDFTTSTANAVGLTVTPVNPSGGKETFEVTGAYSGNAATATALAANPADCAANTFANAIAANGDLTCAAAVTANAGASHNFLTAVSAAGVFSRAQPASTDLSDYGSIPNAALAYPSTTVNGQGCTLGSTCTIPFQTNSSSNTSQAGINFLTSSTNAVGLAVIPHNPGTNQERFEVTGAYTGNVATATALASTPTQCSANVPATGIAANGNANCTTTPSLGAATATSLLATGIVDGLVPTTLVTSASFAIGGTYKSGYYFIQNPTSGAAETGTLPTAGEKQYCVGNSDSAGTANTGTIRVNTSASGQYLHASGARSASWGYVISDGAAGDRACFVGWSSTDWEFYPQVGTWHLH